MTDPIVLGFQPQSRLTRKERRAAADTGHAYSYARETARSQGRDIVIFKSQPPAKKELSLPEMDRQGNVIKNPVKTMDEYNAIPPEERYIKKEAPPIEIDYDNPATPEVETAPPPTDKKIEIDTTVTDWGPRVTVPKEDRTEAPKYGPGNWGGRH